MVELIILRNEIQNEPGRQSPVTCYEKQYYVKNC